MNKDEIRSYMKHAGLRWTKPRSALLDVLFDQPDALRTVDELHQAIQQQWPDVNLSTVYRNLETLVELQWVHRMIDTDGTAKFKIICNSDHHHHLRCLSCGMVKVISYCPMEELHKIAADHHFLLVDHHLELQGYCPSCQRVTASEK